MPNERPNIRMRVEEPDDTIRPHHLAFNLVLENQGNVPAHIIICEVRGGFDGKEHAYDPLNPLDSPTGTFIAPFEQIIIPLTVGGADFPNPVRQFTLHVWVHYRGETTRYSANFSVNRTNGSWHDEQLYDTEYRIPLGNR